MNTKSVLIVGRSPGVLIEAVEILNSRGYDANATNQFDDVLDDYDVSSLDVLVFGGMVPLDTKESLRRIATDLNPNLVVLQGLVGVADVIAAQVESAYSEHRGGDEASIDPGRRQIRLTLSQSAAVAARARWASFADRKLAGNGLPIFDARLEAGKHVIPLPAPVTGEAAFVSLELDS